ncbi:MAG: DUF373 family protein, partial [Fervidicoccaceae archaeon]
MKAGSPKILVLVVDRDNDVGRELGLSTPIVGEQEVEKVALRYASVRPEDSDLNSLFVGLQLYRRLKSESVDAEIALVGGEATDFVRASMKLGREVEELVASTGATEAFVVVDGADDEGVLPVIQSRIRVSGIKRVIVEQWRGVETTYVLLARYARKALSEPRFSRVFLGLPGAVILTVAILKVLGLLNYALAAAAILIGGFMVIRGFNLDDKLKSYWAKFPVIFVSVVLALALAVTGVYVVASSVRAYGVTLNGVGEALGGGGPLLCASFLSLLIGRAVSRIVERDVKVWHDVVGAFLATMFAVAFSRLGNSLSQLTPGIEARVLKSAL